jgi:hypothetical protein
LKVQKVKRAKLSLCHSFERLGVKNAAIVNLEIVAPKPFWTS